MIALEIPSAIQKPQFPGKMQLFQVLNRVPFCLSHEPEAVSTVLLSGRILIPRGLQGAARKNML
ncbi:MAG: hypothetical protein ACXWJT_13630, partial [Xanthobacteraceae bacterium]